MNDKDFSTAAEYFIAVCIMMVLLGVGFAVCRNAHADVSGWNAYCAPYEAQVKEILADEGVDPDFYYLMVAESHCTEGAVSSKGAVGFWQIMPATGKHYGCEDLHDLECSTRAASKYILSLQSRFGSFEHVIAAYNMGGHNFKRNGMSHDAMNLVSTVKRLRNEGYDR